MFEISSFLESPTEKFRLDWWFTVEIPISVLRGFIETLHFWLFFSKWQFKKCRMLYGYFQVIKGGINLDKIGYSNLFQKKTTKNRSELHLNALFFIRQFSQTRCPVFDKLWKWFRTRVVLCMNSRTYKYIGKLSRPGEVVVVFFLSSPQLSRVPGVMLLY